jgi:hypothetical protein
MARTLRCSSPIVLAIATALAVSANACDEEPPVERRLCERFDQCNFFGAGIDVSDCTDIVTMCTDSLLSSERSDWARTAERALENRNCMNFLDAYQEVNACWIDERGEISGAGGGTAESGPADDTTGDTTAGECDAGDRFACAGDRIEGCFDGEPFSLTCEEVCGNDGLQTDGCGFDDERGHDVCFCTAGGSATTSPAPDDTGGDESSGTSGGWGTSPAPTGGEETSASETGLGTADASGPAPP